MPWGRTDVGPRDVLTRHIAKQLCTVSPLRNRITEGIFRGDCPNNPLAQLEKALQKVIASEPFEQTLYRAIRQGLLPERPLSDILLLAIEKGLVTPNEAALVLEGIEAREAVVAVDDFDPASLVKPGLL